MSKKKYTKPALSYRDQIERLKSRNLTVGDEKKAIHLLEVISYYRLSGYWYPLLKDKQNHIFKKNATFETAFSMYKFDREFRQLIVNELEKVEVATRAKMVYVLSHSRGSFWYIDSANFKSHRGLKNTLRKITSEYNNSDDEFIKAFKVKYYDPLPPSWMTMEITTFGSLSHLYSNLKPGKDKRDIAHYFGVNDSTLASWLHSIVYIRNVCAHNSRLWNRVLSISPNIPRKTKNQWLINTNVSNNRMYYILSMILYILNTINPNHSFVYKFRSLLIKHPNIDLKAMGFPVNWEEEPLWSINIFKRSNLYLRKIKAQVDRVIKA